MNKRELKEGEVVWVYFNLHKQTFSVKGKEGKRNVVIKHTDELVLRNVEFIVNEKGRIKTILKKQKQVHAFVKGKVCLEKQDEIDIYQCVKIGYNPYKGDAFVNETKLKEEGIVEKVYNSNLVLCQNKEIKRGVFILN